MIQHNQKRYARSSSSVISIANLAEVHFIFESPNYNLYFEAPWAAGWKIIKVNSSLVVLCFLSFNWVSRFSCSSVAPLELEMKSHMFIGLLKPGTRKTHAVTVGFGTYCVLQQVPRLGKDVGPPGRGLCLWRAALRGFVLEGRRVRPGGAGCRARGREGLRLQVALSGKRGVGLGWDVGLGRSVGLGVSEGLWVAAGWRVRLGWGEGLRCGRREGIGLWEALRVEVRLYAGESLRSPRRVQQVGRRRRREAVGCVHAYRRLLRAHQLVVLLP